MTTRLEDAPLVTDGGSEEGEELDHWCCPCSPLVGLCGTDLSNCTYDASMEEASCVVCDDIERIAAPCLRCGE